ncbi:hypothetical protein J40TS1_40340 [Paenibacillus montaniterrae]|uniref:Uncharacterized protein n=1 Tax=Paenibacillus montaniterrae TaxID=429341 RepID=A0A919YPR2_9BACL|nr:hypothetical protein [Paenibacillus montaniterrae]GIP18392.1 hypothetical protein J40TS1_40340 [Paenibacillus montaniterrae]
MKESSQAANAEQYALEYMLVCLYMACLRVSVTTKRRKQRVKKITTIQPL